MELYRAEEKGRERGRACRGGREGRGKGGRELYRGQRRDRGQSEGGFRRKGAIGYRGGTYMHERDQGRIYIGGRDCMREHIIGQGLI